MPTVWGLTDHRAGNNAQVRGVVERLGYEHSFKPINYNPLAKVPNFMVGAGLHGVNTRKSAALEPPWPDIVVSAGRRLAAVALHIKHKNPQTFVVQMMLPGFGWKQFDLLALPSHDPAWNLPSIVRTLGAPHHVTAQKLHEAAERFAPQFAQCPGFRIGVMIGGNSSYGKMRREDIGQLLFHLGRIAGVASLLVTTSRRTPAFVAPLLETALERRPHVLHAYGKSEGENPYLGILALSDMLIVTGESISMCSEACGTGKPVYILEPARALSHKHRRFLRALYDRGYARPLDGYDPSWSPHRRLDEAGRLAEIIKQRYPHRTGLSE